MKQLLSSFCILFSLTTLGQAWTQQANMPSGRHHPISFSLNGMGYAVTGTAPNGQLTKTVFRYDPGNNSWGSLPNFPGSARSFGIGVVANGKAYIGFGATSSQYLNDLWRFDDSDSSWTQLASCSCSGRRHPAMISIGDRIYVGLGDNNSGDLNDWWMYSITNNTWSQIGNLPGPARHHPFMFNAGGEIFAGLGHSGNSIFRDWYKLDTATNLWGLRTQFPGQARVAGTQFSANGYGYVLSGDGQNHSYMNTGEFWQYDPSQDSWTQLIPHPGRSRWAPGSFVINNEVFFFGGFNRFNNSYPIDSWKYVLFNQTTALAANAKELPQVSIFPNPANIELQWEVEEGISDIKIYNSLGQLAFAGSISKRQISVADWENGTYYLQFFRENRLVQTAKVLIQH